MLTKAEKRRYLTLSGRYYPDGTEEASRKVDETLGKIGDPALRNEIDSLIGELILAHEYKGYEIGRRTVRKRR